MFLKGFLFHVENILFFYSFKLKYLNKKIFLFHSEKTQFFSCEHRIQSHVKKIQFFCSIYLINFDINW